MAESKIWDGSFYKIAGWMLNRLGLKGTALQVYAIIYGFSQDGESEFKGSLQYLMDFTNASKPTVIKALNELVEKGYVIKTENPVNGVKFNTYKASLQVVKKLYSIGKETLPEGSKETLPEGSKETLPNNISLDTESLNTIGDKKETRPLPEHIGSDLQSAFADWLTYKAERKEGYTPTGRKSLETQVLNNVKQYGEAAVAALIRECMASGWKGIIFEKLKTQPQKYGRREAVPDWMQDNPNEDMERMRKYRDQLRTAGNDPDVRAKAEQLKKELGGQYGAPRRGS